MHQKDDVSVLRQKRKLQFLRSNFKDNSALEKYLSESIEQKKVTILALKVAFPIILKRLFVKR